MSLITDENDILKKVHCNSVNWKWKWYDKGNPGWNYVIFAYDGTNERTPSGYGMLGDAWRWGWNDDPSQGDNYTYMVHTGYIKPFPEATVEKFYPAKKATGCKERARFRSSNGVLIFWEPTYAADDNYKGVALIVSREEDGKPTYNNYYCIHKAFLVKTSNPTLFNSGQHRKDMLSVDGTSGADWWSDTYKKNWFYEPFPGMTGYNCDYATYKFPLRAWEEIVGVCIGKAVVDDEGGIKRDDKTCKNLIDTQKIFTVDAIKNKAQYRSYCADNPDFCDNLKRDFCLTTPKSPMCDCINAAKKSEFIAEQRQLSTTMKKAPFACRTRFCNADGKTDGVDIWLTSDRQKELQNCPDIVDQSVNVSGEGNRVNADQSIGDQAKNTNLGGKDEPEPQDNTMVYAMLGFLLVVVLVAVLMGGDDEKKKGKRRGMMPGYGQVMPMYGQMAPMPMMPPQVPMMQAPGYGQVMYPQQVQQFSQPPQFQ